MVRAERLMDLADLLRGREATTIAELARELGVSPRTILRDLATLRSRGMPIAGDAGPGGGIRLERDRGSAAVHFSIAEVVSIWLTARLSREASNLPWGEAATSALAKLLASLPAKKAASLRTLCRRVIVGPPASATIRGGAAAPPPELLSVFEDAFSAGHGLAFQYVDRTGAETRRTVEPHGLLVQPPIWYVLSRDVDSGALRTFRMDRISRPRILRGMTFQPDLDIVRAQVPQRKEWRPLSQLR
jgi:predicted DNA-binding transcriptional regulator YafY